MKETGQTMKVQKKKNVDYGLLLIIVVLLALGLVMVLSASAPYSLRTEGTSYYYFSKQASFALLGLAVMMLISVIDYRILKGYLSYIIIGVAVLLLIAVLIPGVGVERNGATRWLVLFGVQFQPSELMKIALIIFLSAFISKDTNRTKTFFKGYFPCLCIIGVCAGLIFLEDHLSATIIVGILGIVILYTAGAKLRYIFPTIGVATIGVGIAAWIEPYRFKRLMTFLDPWADMQGDGWQIIQSLYAIGSGGIFGVGIGKSIQKYMYIPEPHNDFIFAIWAEELGLVGVIFLMVLFGIFIWRGITIAMKAPDMFGTLLAIGITVMIGIQALFSIAVVSASMPVTGIPLPFFSYGGTSLVMLLACCGILLNISRNASK